VRALFGSVRWSLLLMAFFVYLFIVTTYRIPGGNVAMAVALVALVFQRQSLRVPPTLLWLGAFAVWAGLGYFSTQHPDVVGEQLVNLGKLWLIALVASNAIRTRNQIRFFMVFFLGCFALFPMRGALVNYFIAHYTTFGRALWNYIYSNPNDLAALCLLQLSMAAALFMTEPRGWIKRAATLGMLLLPLLVLLTQSRGAFLAMAAVAVVAVLANKRRGRAILVAGAAVLLLVVVSPGGVWKRVQGLSNMGDIQSQETALDQEGSAFQRFQILKVARKIIVDHPITGVGLGAYPLEHQAYVRGGGFHQTARGKRDTHNTFMNVAAETGIPGLVLFLTAIASAMIPAERARRLARHRLPWAATQIFFLELGMAAFLFAGIFGSYAHLSFTYLHLVLLAAITAATREELRALAAPAAAARARRGPAAGGTRGALPAPAR
jgi:O-antigen ligase